MKDIVFISISKEELTQEISLTIKNELLPFIKALRESNSPTVQSYLTRKQAASRLGISLPTLNDWTKSGIIVGYRIASRVRYKEQELESSLAQIKTRRAA